LSAKAARKSTKTLHFPAVTAAQARFRACAPAIARRMRASASTSVSVAAAKDSRM
jgi:hypothetical protein